MSQKRPEMGEQHKNSFKAGEHSPNVRLTEKEGAAQVTVDKSKQAPPERRPEPADQRGKVVLDRQRPDGVPLEVTTLEIALV